MDHRNWQKTRDILICVICIGIIFWSLWHVLGLFVDAIVIVLLAMAIAFLLTPAVNLLAKSGLPRPLATLLTYIIVIGAIGGIGYELVFSLILQLATFSSTIIDIAKALPDTLRTSINFLETQGHIPADNINNAITEIQTAATSFAQSLPANVVNFITILTNTFLDIFLVVVISFYLTLDGKRIRDSIIGISPKSWLPNVLLFENALSRVVGNYIRGQLTLAVIVGVCTGGICMLTGLGSYALICGFMAFLFETIPMVGPALAAITPLLLSLLLPDPFPRTFEILALFVVLQIIESNILGPRIVGHAVGLHPVAAILALIIGAHLFGIFGALLATPMVAAVWVVVASIYRSARGETAEQILSRRRVSWQVRGPSGNFIQTTRSFMRPPGNFIKDRLAVRNNTRVPSVKESGSVDERPSRDNEHDEHNEDQQEASDLIYSTEPEQEKR